MPVTAFYAALLAPVFIVLSMRIIRRRGQVGALLGDASDPGLLRRVRVQANFAEYVPFALILIGLVESVGTARLLLHGLGLALLAGRLLHAYGMSHENETLAFRVSGMVLTFAAIAGAALACLLALAGV